jgi:hypothetical protein
MTSALGCKVNELYYLPCCVVLCCSTQSQIWLMISFDKLVDRFRKPQKGGERGVLAELFCGSIKPYTRVEEARESYTVVRVSSTK